MGALGARSALALLLATACGSRGPLDVDVIVIEAGAASVEPGQDAGVGAGDTGSPSGADASSDGAPGDGGREAGRFDSGFGPIVDCPVCIGQSCGTQLGACFQSPSCRTTLQCAFTSCVAGDGGGAGGFDPACILRCANGDLVALQQIFAAFQCVTQSCGADCASVLGGR